MIIRKATSKDAEGIANVLKGIYNIDSIKEGKEAFKIERRRGLHYIIAKENGKIVGLTTWRLHGLPKHGLAELDRIAVFKEFRRNGIASKLLQKLEKDVSDDFKKHGKKLRKLFLLSHENNDHAHSFYKKLGFKYQTKLKDHYYKGKHEVIFDKFFD